MVSGIIYFGAYNWEHLGRLQKLGLLQLILGGFFAGVMLRGIDSREGRVLLLGASGVVGGLLAVMGQVYQTGADSYTLFTAWGFLLLPWSFAARSNALWFGELIVTETAFSLWWNQRISDDFYGYAQAFLICNLLLFALWETVRKRSTWATEGISDLALLAGLTPVTLAACAVVIDWDNGGVLCLLLTVGVNMGLIALRREKLFTMATVSASLLCLITTLVGRVVLEIDTLGVLLTAVAIMAQLAFIVSRLTAIHRQNHRDDQEVSRQSVQAPHPEGLCFNLSEAEKSSLEEPGELPWFVQLLVGTGAWLASLFVLIFFLIVVANSEVLLTLFGLALYGGSLYLHSRGEPPLFFRHALLSVHVAGILASTFGLGEMTTSHEFLAGFIVAALCLASLFFYKDSLGSVIFGIGLVTGGAFGCTEIAGDTGVVLWILTIGLLISGIAHRLNRLLQSEFKTQVLPGLRGLVAGLLGLALLANFQILDEASIAALAVIAIGLAVTTSRIQGHPWIATIAICIVGALTYTAASFTLAVFVYLIGFPTRQLLVKSMALVCIAAAGTFFYYNLDLSLIAKSAALIGSGAGLLLFRVVLRAQELKIEEASEYAL